VNKKILVIDDEPELVKALKIRLETKGYEVITAFNGEEGMKKVQEEKSHLIILDVQMPAMDGYRFVRELKKRLDPIPPIIVLTAKDKLQDLFELEGVTDYIIKPFEHQELLDRVSKLLGQD